VQRGTASSPRCAPNRRLVHLCILIPSFSLSPLQPDQSLPPLVGMARGCPPACMRSAIVLLLFYIPNPPPYSSKIPCSKARPANLNLKGTFSSSLVRHLPLWSLATIRFFPFHAFFVQGALLLFPCFDRASASIGGQVSLLHWFSLKRHPSLFVSYFSPTSFDLSLSEPCFAYTMSRLPYHNKCQIFS